KYLTTVHVKNEPIDNSSMAGFKRKREYQVFSRRKAAVIDADNLSDLLNEISEHSVDELFKKKK
ncbi:unnamed protein product, partial [Rotaria socialis]